MSDDISLGSIADEQIGEVAGDPLESLSSSCCILAVVISKFPTKQSGNDSGQFSREF